jgi:tRNA(Ile)-lysidine synthase
MSRSHPPSLLTLALRTTKDASLFAKGNVVLAAVSGGGDSTALLHVLALLRSKVGHELVAHGVDHGLRAEAGAELDLAADLARALGVPMTRSQVSVPKGGNLQARARDARLGALREAAARAGAEVIATGHHADDRAETVLLRLLRGAGPQGLAVLPPRTSGFVRPLIRARRADIEAHLARHCLPHAHDPSNADPRFLRVRVRSELLPLLVQLSPGIVSHLCALADQLSDAAPRDAAGVPAHIGALPRASRDALQALVRTKSAKARVKLPRGLVASYDRAQFSIVVTPEDFAGREGEKDDV